MKHAFLVTVFGIVWAASYAAAMPAKRNGANGNDRILQFHPITNEEYKAILGLTKGKASISEARLITSGLTAIRGIASGIRTGAMTVISNGLQPFYNDVLNKTGTTISDLIGLAHTGTRLNGYPLCVVQANAAGQGRNPEDSSEENNEDDGNENISDNNNAANDDKIENAERPLISCIVVLKNPTSPSKRPNRQPPKKPSPRPGSGNENDGNNGNTQNENQNYGPAQFQKPPYSNVFYAPQFSQPQLNGYTFRPENPEHLLSAAGDLATFSSPKYGRYGPFYPNYPVMPGHPQYPNRNQGPWRPHSASDEYRHYYPGYSGKTHYYQPNYEAEHPLYSHPPRDSYYDRPHLPSERIYMGLHKADSNLQKEEPSLADGNQKMTVDVVDASEKKPTSEADKH